MQPFEDFFIDNITNCDSNDFGAGMKAKLYFAPASYFSEIKLPTATNFQDALLITQQDVKLKDGKLWQVIECLIDENELKAKISGPTKRKRMKASLDVFILGFRAKVLGFIHLMKNEDLICMIQTNDDISILVGNLTNTANIENAEGTLSKKYDDNAGVTVSISTNAPILFFEEKLIINPVESVPVKFITNGGFYDITGDY